MAEPRSALAQETAGFLIFKAPSLGSRANLWSRRIGEPAPSPRPLDTRTGRARTQTRLNRSHFMLIPGCPIPIS